MADFNVDMVENGLDRAVCEEETGILVGVEKRRTEALGMVRREETRRRERLRRAMTGLEEMPMRQVSQSSR